MHRLAIHLLTMTRLSRGLLIMIASLLILGCGGASSDASSGGSINVGTQSNGQPTGKLLRFDNNDNRLWQVDISSGKYSLYESASLQDRLDVIGPSSYINIYPTPGFPGVVYSIKNCVKIDFFLFDSCILVYDENERGLTSIRFAKEMSGIAKLSPNGKYIIVPVGGDSSDVLDYRLYTVKAGGLSQDYTSIEIFNRITSGLVAHDWGANNELYYSYSKKGQNGPTITVTEPNSLDTARTISLPAAYSSSHIVSIDLSNDGGKVLLGMNTPGELSTNLVLIYVLDLDSMELYQPVVNRGSSDAFGANWSPDDKWIKFLHGDHIGNAGAVVLYLKKLLIVPSTSRELQLNFENPTRTPGVLQVFSNDPDLSDIGNDDFTAGWLGASPFWVR